MRRVDSLEKTLMLGGIGCAQDPMILSKGDRDLGVFVASGT